MSLSRKLGLSALVLSLLGAGAGVGVAVTHVADRSVEAPLAQITERRERDAREDEVAMVSTRAPSAAPSVAARPAPTIETRDAVEAERLPSPSTTRMARSRSLDGSRDAEGLRVRRLVVATGIESREPTGVADTFDGEAERLYVFVDLANRGDATEVELSFEPEHESRDAHVTGLVTLEVPGDVGRHRTWAWSRNVHASGTWFAVVRDLEGHELAREAFTIE
ncbi:MAG: hypothetical protein J0L92_26155 [Deltaproteobacteria bacterium]|nr:hypothetical protein [Deltaproteobacteria bacterium]